MYKQLKKDNQGFTIIEIMIVLAIAALILVIVLLAVPALQRNSHNTTSKSAASDVAAAITDSQGQNNGANPTAVSSSGQTVTFTNTSNTTATIPGGYSVVDKTGVAATSTFTASGNNIYVSLGFSCTTPTSGTITQGSSTGTGGAVYYPVQGTTAGWACLQG